MEHDQGFPNSVERWVGGWGWGGGEDFFLLEEGLHKEYFQSFKAIVMLKLIFHIY